MKALVPYLKPNCRHFLMAAEELGYETISVLCASGAQASQMKRDFGDYPLIEMPTRFSLKMDRFEYSLFFEKALEDLIKRERISIVLPVSSSDGFMKSIGRLNDKYNLPGITFKQGELFADKYLYGRAFEKIGIRVPKIYQLVDDGEIFNASSEIKFPCLCKPREGNGSYGVFVANNLEELDWFFAAEVNEYNFSELSRFNQEVHPAGGLRNYLYSSCGHGYLIQEFLHGPTISAAGNFHINGLSLDIVYDIKSADLPFRSEVGFTYPSRHLQSQHDIQSMAEKIRKNIDIPLGPFMMDLIYTGEGLALVDFSPRASSSAIELLHFSLGNNSYLHNSLHAMLGEPVLAVSPKNRVSYSRITLPVGRVKSFELPGCANLASELNCEVWEGLEIYVPRNDTQASTAGHVVFLGEESETLASEFSRELKYEMESI